MNVINDGIRGIKKHNILNIMKSIFLYVWLDLKPHDLSYKFISKLPGESQ